MLVQKPERRFAVYAVSALEVFDVELVGESKLRVEPADFGKLVRDLAVATDSVVVAAFDHERTRHH